MSSLRKNLPHIYNSCGINALFIALTYLDVNSNDKLIKTMLKYCMDSDENPDIYKFGILLMQKFYETYNITYEFQNARSILNKFYSKLIFKDSQVEIGDDYEKIELNKETILLDYEQVKNMVEYNVGVEDDKDKIVMYYNRLRVYNHTEAIKYNDNIYFPSIYIVCINHHYLTLINTVHGLLIYDDINKIRVIPNEQKIRVITNLRGIEFIGYIKKSK